jgi:hypothetical protein
MFSSTVGVDLLVDPREQLEALHDLGLIVVRGGFFLVGVSPVAPEHEDAGGDGGHPFGACDQEIPLRVVRGPALRQVRICDSGVTSSNG